MSGDWLAMGAVAALAVAVAGSRRRGSRDTAPIWFDAWQAAEAAALAKREAVTGTEAFRSWFANSEIVDATGQPRVCYHGSRNAFATFSDEDAPYRGGLLAFFAAEARFAGNYAGPPPSDSYTSGSPHVYPVYLRIERLFDYRRDWRRAVDFYAYGGGIGDDHEARRILMGFDQGPDPEDIMDTRWGAPDLTAEVFAQAVKRGWWPAIEADEFVEWLHDYEEYDGLVIYEGESVNYGVFEPWQIKSATGNLGTFDVDEAAISLNRRSR